MRALQPNRQYVCFFCAITPAPRRTPSSRSISIPSKAIRPRRVNAAPFSSSPRWKQKAAAASSSTTYVTLTTEQTDALQALHIFVGAIQRTIQQKQQNVNDLSARTAFDLVPKDLVATPNSDKLVERYHRLYQGRSYDEFFKDWQLVHNHRRVKNKNVTEETAASALYRLGIISEPIREPPSVAKTAGRAATAALSTEKVPKVTKATSSDNATVAEAPKPSPEPDTQVLRKIASKKPAQDPPQARTEPESGGSDFPIAQLDQSILQTLNVSLLDLKALDLEKPVGVPQLSFDLSRVLFNPGVYMLQDPRSRVYNFDPYLEHLMPVTDFNFEALNAYVTSSEDEKLRGLARRADKRYVGSSSSMSGTLQHFHFLLSQWRPLSPQILSQFFFDTTKRDEAKRADKFTRIQRAPAAIFLRYKDGIYAVDADKEFDDANVLMHLGRSMEKLFTVEKEVFETYRKSGNTDALPQAPESYHYSEAGQFLLRSQLDAHDPRLPGTGMFDLKTRAVVPIRMNMQDYERGTGYEIRGRYGAFRSYEREYYDMIRSAFLKYSLQVRMGRMDGIFVAYHNIRRIFGFQYISLAELDLALHGQSNRTLGDLEFNASINLVNRIFNEATMKFPGKSLRLHFQTLEPSIRRPTVSMEIFAEAMSEEEIVKIQETNKAKIEAWNKKLFQSGASELDTEEESTDESDGETASEESSNAADEEFLDEVLAKPALPADTQNLAAWKLTIRNIIDGQPALRPVAMDEEKSWKVDYTLEPIEPSQIPGKYTAIKNRRQNELDNDLKVNKSTFPYLRRLMQLSDEGRLWREQQDEIDSKREKVVLYPGSGTDHARQTAAVEAA